MPLDRIEPAFPSTLPPIPHLFSQWYVLHMEHTWKVPVGDRGRLVIPAEVRERAGLASGTVLTLFENDNGLVLLTRDQLRERVHADLAGLDLVSDLIAGRHHDSAREDRESRGGEGEAA